MFESIPGAAIQASANLAKSRGPSLLPLLSLTSSILTSSVISTQIRHELDTSSEQRGYDPAFYGYLSKTQDAYALASLFVLRQFFQPVRIAVDWIVKIESH